MTEVKLSVDCSTMARPRHLQHRNGVPSELEAPLGRQSAAKSLRSEQHGSHHTAPSVTRDAESFQLYITSSTQYPHSESYTYDFNPSFFSARRGTIHLDGRELGDKSCIAFIGTTGHSCGVSMPPARDTVSRAVMKKREPRSSNERETPAPETLDSGVVVEGPKGTLEEGSTNGLAIVCGRERRRKIAATGDGWKEAGISRVCCSADGYPRDVYQKPKKFKIQPIIKYSSTCRCWREPCRE